MEGKKRSVCLIPVCGEYMSPRCCTECGRTCSLRCLNTPDKCGMQVSWSEEFLAWQRDEIARYMLPEEEK